MYCHVNRAVVFVYALEESIASRLRLKGLDEGRQYRIQEINPECGNETTLSGAHLCDHGLQMPTLGRFESVVFLLTAV